MTLRLLLFNRDGQESVQQAAKEEGIEESGVQNCHHFFLPLAKWESRN